MMAECRWCDRICRRCHYPIPGGREHVEQVQPAASNVVVCALERLQPRPLVEVLNEYFDHHRHSTVGGEHFDAYADDSDWAYLRWAYLRAAGDEG